MGVFLLILHPWTCSIENVQCVSGRIALVLFMCFTSKHVFLACTDKTHTYFTVIHTCICVSFTVRSIIHLGKHHSSVAALLLMPILGTDSLSFQYTQQVIQGIAVGLDHLEEHL